MRLEDGTVWMLSMPGQIWTDQRLQTAAETLSNVSANAYTKTSTERLLRAELRVSSMCLDRPAIGLVDFRQWAVREVAFYLARQPAISLIDSSNGEPEGGVWLSSVEKALVEGLDDATQEFMEGLEPKSLGLASTSGQLNHRLYNYLAYKSYHQFRIQFAETFPSLLLTSVLPEKDDLGTQLRPIVHSGAPVIKTLSNRWNVRPGVVRHLVGKLTGLIGLQWSRSAQGLALALNALRPGDLPGDVAREWTDFNHMVAVGQRLFRCRIWESTAALEWLS